MIKIIKKFARRIKTELKETGKNATYVLSRQHYERKSLKLIVNQFGSLDKNYSKEVVFDLDFIDTCLE